MNDRDKERMEKRHAEHMHNLRLGAKITALILVTLALVASVPMAVMPKYKVWSAHKSGQAHLAKAKNERQVQIEDAKGRLEAEKLNAQSEVARAEGAAQAIKIENGSLNQQYIQYLWVRKLDLSDSKTIYVPTEAGLPVLEAGKR